MVTIVLDILVWMCFNGDSENFQFYSWGGKG